MNVLVRHIDGLILFAFAAAFVALSVNVFPKQRRILRILAGVLVMCGIASFFFSTTGLDDWRIQKSDDGRAEVTFPGKPERMERMESVAGESLRRVTYRYKYPHQETYLLLSTLPLPKSALALSHKGHVEGLIALMQGQGATLLRGRELSNGMTDLTFLNNTKQYSIRLRMASGGGQSYYAIVTSAVDVDPGEPAKQFLASFRVKPAQASR